MAVVEQEGRQALSALSLSSLSPRDASPGGSVHRPTAAAAISGKRLPQPAQARGVRRDTASGCSLGGAPSPAVSVFHRPRLSRRHCPLEFQPFVEKLIMNKTMKLIAAAAALAGC